MLKQFSFVGVYVVLLGTYNSIIFQVVQNASLHFISLSNWLTLTEIRHSKILHLRASMELYQIEISESWRYVQFVYVACMGGIAGPQKINSFYKHRLSFQFSVIEFNWIDEQNTNCWRNWNFLKINKEENGTTTHLIYFIYRRCRWSEAKKLFA